MIGYVGRLIAMQKDGWLYTRRSMGGYVGSPPACFGSSLGSNPDISQKIQNGRHKQRSGQHTLARQN
jgi:hypothetical protein